MKNFTFIVFLFVSLSSSFSFASSGGDYNDANSFGADDFPESFDSDSYSYSYSASLEIDETLVQPRLLPLQIFFRHFVSAAGYGNWRLICRYFYSMVPAQLPRNVLNSIENMRLHTLPNLELLTCYYFDLNCLRGPLLNLRHLRLDFSSEPHYLVDLKFQTLIRSLPFALADNLPLLESVTLVLSRDFLRVAHDRLDRIVRILRELVQGQALIFRVGENTILISLVSFLQTPAHLFL